MTTVMSTQTTADMETNHAAAFLTGTAILCVGLIAGLLFINVLSALLVAGAIGTTALLTGGCLLACITAERRHTPTCQS